MAKYLGRWRMTDVCPPIGPRDGALLRQAGDGGAPHRTHDQVRRPRPRPRYGRDQEGEGEGELLCTIAQHGQTGEWSGEDAEGQPLSVRGGLGGLSIYRVPQAEDQADPDIVGPTPPGAETLDQLRRRMAPRQINDSLPAGRQGDQLAAYQAYLDRHYAPK